MASATGPSDARYETTAAWQAAETSNVALQQDVERNAEKARAVAEQAASVAPYKSLSAEQAVNQLEAGLASSTPEDQPAGYVEQARNLASSALATASSYLPSSTGTDSSTANANGTGVVSSLQSAAGTAAVTAKNVLSSAQQTIQPYAESAMNAAQPHIDSAVNAAQPHINRVANAISGGQTTRPDDVPATTAPLESSGGVVGGPYPETATGGKSTVGQV